MTQKDFLLARQECPVCTSPKKKILFTDLIHTCNVLKMAGIKIDNTDVPVDVYQCLNCKHKYLSQIIKEDLLMHYYSVIGSQYYDSVKENPIDRLAKDTLRFARLIKKECNDASTVLEIGSGMGYLLSELQQLGFTCTGVEPSDLISNMSREKFGLSIISGILNYETFPNKKFDLIILSDVIEHIYDPNKLFLLIEHYLSVGGKVIVLTGDSNSLYAKMCGKKWLYLFSWEHISYFNRSSIRELFNRHNMEMSYFRKRRHSGTFFENCKTFMLTLRGMLANTLGFRKHKFFYMAFDHFIAMGTKKKG